MDANDKIHQIIAHLASAAAAAADGVSGAVQQAGKTVGVKYDAVRLHIEINRLHDEQKKIFADIGRTMFSIKNGVLGDAPADSPTDESAQAEPGAEAKAEGAAVDPQQTVDQLLILADQKQKEIEFANERLAHLGGAAACPVCGKTTHTDDAYCAACGAKLTPDS